MVRGCEEGRPALTPRLPDAMGWLRGSQPCGFGEDGGFSV